MILFQIMKIRFQYRTCFRCLSVMFILTFLPCLKLSLQFQMSRSLHTSHWPSLSAEQLPAFSSCPRKAQESHAHQLCYVIGTHYCMYKLTFNIMPACSYALRTTTAQKKKSAAMQHFSFKKSRDNYRSLIKNKQLGLVLQTINSLLKPGLQINQDI